MAREPDDMCETRYLGNPRDKGLNRGGFAGGSNCGSAWNKDPV